MIAQRVEPRVGFSMILRDSLSVLPIDRARRREPFYFFYFRTGRAHGMMRETKFVTRGMMRRPFTSSDARGGGVRAAADHV